MYSYDENFYTYISENARRSAQVLLPALVGAMPAPVKTVLDVGCGAGAWLSVWKELGADVLGLDGAYVRLEQILIEREEFLAVDLQKGFALNRQFDLVQSLEVAEHLPASSAGNFVANLCKHAPLVLFSAATPGQGGENHINERHYEYWRALFKQQGFVMYDPVRLAIKGNSCVKSWYRYNTFLYVGEQCSPETRAALQQFLVPPGQPPLDISPLTYRMRKQLVRVLPQSVSTALAVVKKSLYRLSPK